MFFTSYIFSQHKTFFANKIIDIPRFICKKNDIRFPLEKISFCKKYYSVKKKFIPEKKFHSIKEKFIL